MKKSQNNSVEKRRIINKCAAFNDVSVLWCFFLIDKNIPENGLFVC